MFTIELFEDYNYLSVVLGDKEPKFAKNVT